MAPYSIDIKHDIYFDGENYLVVSAHNETVAVCETRGVAEACVRGLLCVVGENGGKQLEVEVRAVGTFLNIHVEGYGQPVSLDYSGGKLQVLVNDDKEVDEPRRISLEGAKTTE